MGINAPEEQLHLLSDDTDRGQNCKWVIMQHMRNIQGYFPFETGGKQCPQAIQN